MKQFRRPQDGGAVQLACKLPDSAKKAQWSFSSRRSLLPRMPDCCPAILAALSYVFMHILMRHPSHFLLELDFPSVLCTVFSSGSRHGSVSEETVHHLLGPKIVLGSINVRWVSISVMKLSTAHFVKETIAVLVVQHQHAQATM